MESIIKLLTERSKKETDWKLVSKKNIQYFQSRLLLKNEFTHAFFTKNCTDNHPSSLQSHLKYYNHIHTMSQVHSNNVCNITDKLNTLIPNVDALITTKPHQSLWIYTADCIPVLLADTGTRNIAAVHAGLNGIKQNIIKKTIESLKQLGTKSKNILVILGPGISKKNYQVNSEYKEIFSHEESHQSYTVTFNKKLKREETLNYFDQPEKSQKILLDLQASIIIQALKEGINPDKIRLNRLCTYENDKLFNSWRREHSKARQWSFIGS